MPINAARGQSSKSRNQKMLCRYAGRPVDDSSELCCGETNVLLSSK